jgi:hypothetical protein
MVCMVLGESDFLFTKDTMPYEPMETLGRMEPPNKSFSPCEPSPSTAYQLGESLLDHTSPKS